MNRATKLLIPAFLAIFIFAHCKKLDIDVNCLNSLSTCFKPDKTAPSLKTYSPIPNKGSNLVSILTGIQVNFSEEMKDRTNKDHYKLSGPGAAGLTIESVSDADGSSVVVNIKGTVANNAINLTFPGLTDYGGNALSSGTQASLTGSVNIGITTQEAPSIYYISNVSGFTNAVIHWYHDYADDNNNLYFVQPTGSTCADPQATFPGGGTNLSGGPVTAGSGNMVTTTIPIATNFTTDGTYIVTICLKNSGANKSGELEIPIVRDTVVPIIQANIGSGAYGAPQVVTFTCSDNCNNIAYVISEGTSMPADPVSTPAFNATGGVTTGTQLTGTWATPLTSDPWCSKIKLKAFDKAGNQSTATIFSYQIDTLLPTTVFASPATTHDYVSALAGGYNSTVLTWSADKGSAYRICVGDTGTTGVSGCAAGPTCNGGTGLGTAQPYTPGSTVNTTINATPDLPVIGAAGNRVHVCVQSGATVGDATYTLIRDGNAPAVASTVPTDGANGVIPTTAITINFTETIGLDASTLTAATTSDPNVQKVACTGSIQVSLASDNFTGNTCLAMTSATATMVSSTVYKVTPVGRLGTGVYKIRVTTAVRDLAGNPIAAIFTQPAGFTITGLLRMFTFNNGANNLTDQAGGNLNLVTVGSPQKVTGVDGDANGAYKFDGSGTDYLSGFDDQLPTGAAPRTVCAWINPAEQCNGYCMATMYGSTTRGPYLGIRTGKAAFGYYGGLDYLGGAALSLNTWVHICSVYNGTTQFVYVNGVQDGSNASAPNTTLAGAGGVSVGRSSGGGVTYGFPGRVDDVRIYAGALSTTEMRQMAVQVPNGLLAYYSFSDAASGTAIDYSGNGHTGIRNGSPLPTILNDRFGVNGAYSFGSPSQYITAQDTNLPQGTSPRTVCAWMRPTSLPPSGQYRIAMRYGQPVSGAANYIGLYNDGAQQTVIFSGWSDHLTSPYTAATNTWMHLCGTYDGATARLYLNGGQVAFAAKAWNTTLMGTDGIIIGQGDLTGTFPFQGGVDDVRIYNRVLADNEILALSSQLGIGLLRQFTFTNGSVTDDVAPGSALSVTGSPTQVAGFDGAANGAYAFTGTEQFSITDAGLPAGSTARTMCSWVYVTNTNTDGFPISYGAPQTNSQGSFLYADSSNNLGFGSYSANLQSNYVIPLNSWHHLCGTLDGNGNATVYVDGSVAPGGSATPITFSTVLSGNLAIGARSDNSFRWRGRLDGLRVYNRALGAAEILQLQDY